MLSRVKLIKNMQRVLDWGAKEYKTCDEELKDRIATDFSVEAKAFNQLIMDMYPKTSGADLFPKNIDTYIMIRECEYWQ